MIRLRFVAPGRSARAWIAALAAIALMIGASARAQDEPGASPLPPDHPPAPSSAPASEPPSLPVEPSLPAADTPPDPHPEHHEEQPPGAPPQPREGSDDPADAPEPSALPSGHPAVSPGSLQGAGAAGAGAAAMHGGASREAIARAMRPPAAASAEPSDDVEVGTIRVTVVGPDGQPIPDAAVDVGSLAQGDRNRWNERTDGSGVALFEGMPTGTQQAYRVNVPHEGATYSTTPFQLPTDEGFDVRVVRLDVTRDPRAVFFHTFRVIVEQRGERMHVIHQTELTNAGAETYVFPSEGERVDLPEQATAFQFQRVITDQRIEEIEADEGTALVMRGSLPPGTVRLAYAYDLPIGDEDMAIAVDIPFPVFGLQILGEAIPGLTMDVVGMSGERRLDQHGQPCESSQVDPTCVWMLTRHRRPDEPPIQSLTIRVSGIPGPSPVRWIAVALALLLALGGVGVALRGHDRTERITRARERRRAELLREAAALQEELEAGEVGPEYHRKRRAAIVRELAVVMAAEDEPSPRRA